MKKVDLPLKLVLELPIYRKPTKKLKYLAKCLSQLRMGFVAYDDKENLFRFKSADGSNHFAITDSYFKNPQTGKVEFEQFSKFRSTLNLIIAVASSEETDVKISIIDCSDEITSTSGIYANLTLSVTSNSPEQFRKITSHLKLLDLS